MKSQEIDLVFSNDMTESSFSVGCSKVRSVEVLSMSSETLAETATPSHLAGTKVASPGLDRRSSFTFRLFQAAF